MKPRLFRRKTPVKQTKKAKQKGFLSRKPNLAVLQKNHKKKTKRTSRRGGNDSKPLVFNPPTRFIDKDTGDLLGVWSVDEFASPPVEFNKSIDVSYLTNTMNSVWTNCVENDKVINYETTEQEEYIVNNLIPIGDTRNPANNYHVILYNFKDNISEDEKDNIIKYMQNNKTSILNDVKKQSEFKKKYDGLLKNINDDNYEKDQNSFLEDIQKEKLSMCQNLCYVFLKYYLKNPPSNGGTNLIFFYCFTCNKEGYFHVSLYVTNDTNEENKTEINDRNGYIVDPWMKKVKKINEINDWRSLEMEEFYISKEPYDFNDQSNLLGPYLKRTMKEIDKEFNVCFRKVNIENLKFELAA